MNDKLIKKKDFITIPNILSYVRLLFLPLFVWLYCFKMDYYKAAGVIVISGITDVADGYIARHFNQVTKLGTLLDPTADKLTQAVLLFCLILRYDFVMVPFIIFVVKEITMLVMGIVFFKRTREMSGAKWYGKLCTAVLYVSVTLLVLLPGIPKGAAMGMMGACSVMLCFSLLMYSIMYFRLFKAVKTEKDNPQEVEGVMKVRD